MCFLRQGFVADRKRVVKGDLNLFDLHYNYVAAVAIFLQWGKRQKTTQSGDQVERGAIEPLLSGMVISGAIVFFLCLRDTYLFV